MTLHRLVPLSLLAFAAGCSFPRFVATRTLVQEIPLDPAVCSLRCASHNGDISVVGSQGRSELRMRVTMKVRGHTQQEADSNLAWMSIRHEVVDGEFRLTGRYDQAELSGMSPAFTFLLEAPSNLALNLESHNGDIHTEGTIGALAVDTHNGEVRVAAQANEFTLSSHNGDVVADIRSEGATNGLLESHNGDVVLLINGTPDATIRAATHNGTARIERSPADVASGRRQLTCRIGDGDGEVVLSTHNGDIVVR